MIRGKHPQPLSDYILTILNQIIMPIGLWAILASLFVLLMIWILRSKHKLRTSIILTLTLTTILGIGSFVVDIGISFGEAFNSQINELRLPIWLFLSLALGGLFTRLNWVKKRNNP